MEKTPVDHAVPDAFRASVLKACMDNYGVGGADADWPNNLISRRTVVYGNGAISNGPSAASRPTDPDELGLCKRLSSEVAAVVAGIPVGMGSESGDSFAPFFIAGLAGCPPAQRIDAALIRSRFDGTLFPPVTIQVEPVAVSSPWWKEVEEDGQESGPDFFKPWLSLIRWFGSRKEFADTAFVRIGDYDALHGLDESQYPAGTEITGCVMPRLFLGLTTNGSLAGLFGYTVQT